MLFQSAHIYNAEHPGAPKPSVHKLTNDVLEEDGPTRFMQKQAGRVRTATFRRR